MIIKFNMLNKHLAKYVNKKHIKIYNLKVRNIILNCNVNHYFLLQNMI